MTVSKMQILPGPADVWVEPVQVEKGLGQLPASNGGDYSQFPNLPQGKCQQWAWMLARASVVKSVKWMKREKQLQKAGNNEKALELLRTGKNQSPRPCVPASDPPIRLNSLIHRDGIILFLLSFEVYYQAVGLIFIVSLKKLFI